MVLKHSTFIKLIQFLKIQYYFIHQINYVQLMVTKNNVHKTEKLTIAKT